MRMVDMAAQHRSGNTSRHKTKRAPRIGTPVLKKTVKDLLDCRSHVDAAQLERFAVHRALYGHVMAGMRRHFVLRIDHVHFLVGIVHEHVLGAMLLDALGRALAGLVVCAFYSTLAV